MDLLGQIVKIGWKMANCNFWKFHNYNNYEVHDYKKLESSNI